MSATSAEALVKSDSPDKAMTSEDSKVRVDFSRRIEANAELGLLAQAIATRNKVDCTRNLALMGWAVRVRHVIVHYHEMIRPKLKKKSELSDDEIIDRIQNIRKKLKDKPPHKPLNAQDMRDIDYKDFLNQLSYVLYKIFKSDSVILPFKRAVEGIKKLLMEIEHFKKYHFILQGKNKKLNEYDRALVMGLGFNLMRIGTHLKDVREYYYRPKGRDSEFSKAIEEEFQKVKNIEESPEMKELCEALKVDLHKFANSYRHEKETIFADNMEPGYWSSPPPWLQPVSDLIRKWSQILPEPDSKAKLGEEKKEAPSSTQPLAAQLLQCYELILPQNAVGITPTPVLLSGGMQGISGLLASSPAVAPAPSDRDRDEEKAHRQKA